MPMRYVCSECFDDHHIKRFVEYGATSNVCNYCSNRASEPIAINIYEVTEYIAEALMTEWYQPEEGAIWDSETKDWLFSPTSTRDVFEAIDFRYDGREDLFEDILDIINSKYGHWWFDEGFGYSMTTTERLDFGWRDFVEHVKHIQRYFFSVANEEPEFPGPELKPHEMLDEIGKAVLAAGLIEKLEIGTTIIRVRIHPPEEEYTTAEELGTVTQERAIFANRMSPAGIPMFYGCPG